jgi:hypothetical protein
MKCYFVVYRQHTEPIYHTELVGLCKNIKQAVGLLDQPNFDKSIWETWFDEDGMIHTAIEITDPFKRVQEK